MSVFLVLLGVGMVIATAYCLSTEVIRTKQKSACEHVLIQARDERLLDDYDWDMVVWRRKFERWLKSGTRLPPPFIRPRIEDYKD